MKVDFCGKEIILYSYKMKVKTGANGIEIMLHSFEIKSKPSKCKKRNNVIDVKEKRKLTYVKTKCRFLKRNNLI